MLPSKFPGLCGRDVGGAAVQFGVFACAGVDGRSRRGYGGGAHGLPGGYAGLALPGGGVEAVIGDGWEATTVVAKSAWA